MRALWSPTILHLGFDCEEPGSEAMAFDERQRDDPKIWKDASIEIFLNPANDRAGYFQIIVNAAGSMTDIAYRRENGATVRDLAWDSQATAAVRVDAERWTAELALPWKALEAEGRKAGDEIVANFNRTRLIRGGAADDNQHYTWSPFIDLRAGGFHKPDRFGRLQLVAHPVPSRALLKNGSFEHANTNPQLAGLPGDWFFPQDAAERSHFALAEGEGRDGHRALRIQSDQPVTVCCTQRLPGLKPATRYTLSCFIRTQDVQAAEPGGGVYLNLFCDSRQNIFLPTSGYLGSQSWTKQGFTVTTGASVGTPDGKIQPYLRLYLRGATGTVWFDAVRLQEADAAE